MAMVKLAERQPKVEVIRYGDKISAMLTGVGGERVRNFLGIQDVHAKKKHAINHADKEENRKISRLKQPMVEESVRPFQAIRTI